MEIPYKDLREWLSKVDEMGQIRVAKSIDLEEDVGRIAEISASLESAPTLVLDEFPGYEPGYRILLNPYGSTRQIAFTFGFPLDSEPRALVEHFREKLESVQPIPPKYVDSGAVFENRLVGDEVNLYRFPVPKWHREDGGPYIGTGCLVVTQDPDEGWVNLGTYRNQLHDQKTVGFYIAPGHHGRIHRDKYFSRGQPCPVAIIMGSDPLLFAGSMLEFPWGIGEYDWAGGWRGEPVEVVKGPVTGLPIPANAEIVIEGFSEPEKTRLEGPFGEWTGYYASDVRPEPYVEVQAVYFRNNPILLGMPPQKPPYDADKARQYIKSALLIQSLRQQGIPGIVSAWCYGFGGCRLLIAVAIQQRYFGHSRQVGHAAYSSIVANISGRYVVVVDDDIDVTDINDVAWAVLTRSDPATSIDIVPRSASSRLDPRMSPEERAAGRYYNSRAIIDATKPFEWREQFPQPSRPDQEYRRESREKFAHLFEL
jgi:4-hydroxy-3-polyprenylbenzoate decarboxylase